MQCSQQTGLADIELRGTGETQFGIRPSRILSKWINQGFSRVLLINAVFYIFSIHNYCRVINIEKTAEFLLIDDAFSF